jgi:hypothetical protein
LVYLQKILRFKFQLFLDLRILRQVILLELFVYVGMPIKSFCLFL